MRSLQRILLSVLPRQMARSIRSESKGWRIRCCTCGASHSVWDAGGIRWGAAAIAKRALVHCAHCGRLRLSAVEWNPEGAGADTE